MRGTVVVPANAGGARRTGRHVAFTASTCVAVSPPAPVDAAAAEAVVAAVVAAAAPAVALVPAAAALVPPPAAMTVPAVRVPAAAPTAPAVPAPTAAPAPPAPPALPAAAVAAAIRPVPAVGTTGCPYPSNTNGCNDNNADAKTPNEMSAQGPGRMRGVRRCACACGLPQYCEAAFVQPPPHASRIFASLLRYSLSSNESKCLCTADSLSNASWWVVRVPVTYGDDIRRPVRPWVWFWSTICNFARHHCKIAQPDKLTTGQQLL